MATRISYTHCTSATAVTQAASVLSQSSDLILDCEGNELGRAGGALSLICVGAPSSPTVYVFDAVVLDQTALAPVLQLLSSKDIRKLVWDGRQDDIELYTSYGVALTNVLDLQLVDIESRKMKGEREYQRLGRLRSYFRNCMDEFPNDFGGLQCVTGMQRCLNENNLIQLGSKDARVAAMFKSGGGGEWMKRPLNPILLAYGAKDIRLIGLILDHFERSRYFTASTLPKLLAQSQRYISMHRTAGRPKGNDPFLNSPVLPLCILDEASSSAVVYQCSGCMRKMPLSCFKRGTGVDKHNASHRARRGHCNACFVIAKKNGLEDGGWVRY